jgi:hypothetical protein
VEPLDRRTALKLLAAWLAAGVARPGAAPAEDVPLAPPAAPATAPAAAPAAGSNFRAVYADPVQRDRFHAFLANVFHLYPEDRFHALIAELVARGGSDREIYEALQARLPEIAPPLSTVTYALPALAKQKEEMARQTAALLGRGAAVRGYVEIGSPGRYVRPLRDALALEGPVFLVNDFEPGLAPLHVVERGQLRRAGRYVPLGDYEGFGPDAIPDAGVDLVTNFIGFHHAPAAHLERFVASIRRALRPGGRLVVRDHDVDGPAMHAMVGLAHDVFNAGVALPWRENERQVRNFTSVAELEALLETQGFERAGGALLQDGDPTRNALLLFVRT